MKRSLVVSGETLLSVTIRARLTASSGIRVEISNSVATLLLTAVADPSLVTRISMPRLVWILVSTIRTAFSKKGPAGRCHEDSPMTVGDPAG